MKKQIVAGNILLAITIIALCGTLFQGCASTPSNQVENTPNPLQEHKKYIGFDAVYSCQDDGVNYTYYRCRLTDVIYVWREHWDDALYSDETYGGMTIMMDPETNGPLTYDNWLKRLEQKKIEDNTGTIDIQLVYECSACGKEFKVESRPNYCPGCGEMAKEE